MLAVTAACATTALGAVPYAIAAVEPNATTLLAESIDGAATTVPGNVRPPNVPLLEQHGRPISFDKLHGKVLLVTYLDPVCTTDCPVIAQEFKQVPTACSAAKPATWISWRSTPTRSTALPPTCAPSTTRSASNSCPTGSTSPAPSGSCASWGAPSGVEIFVPGGGAMVNHPDGAAVIDREGQIRSLANFDPGPATSSTKSSFAVTLVQAARQALNEA